MQIRQIMSKPVLTCRPSDALDTAARLMWEHDCGAVPVTGDDGKVVGVITDRDICMATYTKGRAPHDIAVGDAMAKRVFSCRADDAVEVAETIMRERQVRRVPVVDRNNRPVGLISLNDLARYAVSAPKKNGTEREIVETLAAVCRPRTGAIEVSRPAALQKRASAPH